MGPPVLGLTLHALELVVRGVRQDVARAVAGDRDEEQVAQTLKEVLNEAARVMAGLDHAFDDAECRGAVTTREGVDVCSGVNVPMLIEVISGAGRKNATLKSLVAKAHKAGTKGIRSFQEANQPAAAKPAEAKPAETKAVEVPAAQQVPGGTMDAIFTRIDSRLIHGQVAGTWVPHIAPQTFIAASDNAAHDQLRKSLLLQVAPTSVKTNVLDIAKAGRVYNNPKYTGMKTMFVVESPVDVVRLLDEGVKINEVNVGGVTFKTGMVQLSDAVYASEEHLEAYRELIKRGVKLTVQQLPNHSPVDLEKILKQKGLDA